MVVRSVKEPSKEILEEPWWRIDEVMEVLLFGY